MAARRRLFPHALAAAKNVASAHRGGAAKKAAAAAGGAGMEAADDVERHVARAYAASLASERRHEDAAVTFLSAGDPAAALEQYREALAWRPALTLAARLGMSARERRAVAEELAEGMEHTDPAAAAAVAAQHLGDVDRAVGKGKCGAWGVGESSGGELALLTYIIPLCA